jgi:TPR repeat protein
MHPRCSYVFIFRHFAQIVSLKIMNRTQEVIYGIILAVFAVMALDVHSQTKFVDIRNAAERGNAIAEYKLGLAYVNGDGVEKNMSLAASWFRKAAEQGSAEAEYHLGVMCAAGTGVAQDPHQAIVWY